MLLCKETGPEFLTSLTAFTNMVLAGGCPPEVAAIFLGGRLIALNKKSGGIWPIVIGFTLRKLVSKCASKFGSERLQEYFNPHELGVGIEGGCEATIHSVRRFLQFMPADNVFVKLDFSDAFNNLHRTDMLEAIACRIPELNPYIHSAYSTPSTLFFGQYRISSQVGPQQGDPVGPLCFSNTIHPLLLSLDSTLNLGYLDDVSLGGPMDVVAADVATIIKTGSQLGLSLNISKCELITHSGFNVTDSILSSFTRVSLDNAVLLGAPLIPGPALDEAWASRYAELQTAADRLSSIGAQEALILIRSFFSAPKVMHLLRCTPSMSHPALHTFDNKLKETLQKVTNTTL